MPNFYGVPKQKAVDFIAHYASEYYDPAKAREYYLRTRELKGRGKAQPEKPPENETKEQRKARQDRARAQRESAGRTRDAKAYAKNQIRTKRSADLDSLSAANKARTEAIRQKAEETSARIEAKLDALLRDLANQKPKLNPIPKNASPQLRAFLTKQNQKLAETAQKNTREVYDKAREEATAAKRKLGTDLKAAVSQARAEYAAAKEQLKAQYEQAEETEMQNIEKNVR